MKKKQVIFNVGGALSTYVEIGERKIVIDLGKSDDFSPVDDFLLPYFKKEKFSKNSEEKFLLDQLILSHPHYDHISDIELFQKEFYPNLLTTPNDNDGMALDEKINWELVNDSDKGCVKFIREKMLPGRTPPLRSSDTTTLFLYYIKPKECETDDDLDVENYTNNISLVVFLRLGGEGILLPGDLMKDGMEHLIDDNSGFRNKLKDGVGFLIAPHHGLKSSFSTKLFEKMKNKKTKRLNIVSEKVTQKGDARQVDSRYSSEDYCEGDNNLSTDDERAYQVKTSRGHIVIDYDDTEPRISILNTKELLEQF